MGTRILIPFIFALLITPYVNGSEWYQNLPPGTTRDEVLRMAGPPSSSTKGLELYPYSPKMGETFEAEQDRYDLSEGRLELAYHKSMLISCNEYRSGFISQCYSQSGGELSASELQRRTEYLKAGQYSQLPGFSLPEIRTAKYPAAACYKVGESYLVIEPILPLMAADGFFADKTARITLIDSKKQETVLYRAIDQWRKLRPPHIDERQVKSRTQAVQAMRSQDQFDPNMSAIFGGPDSTMGSGITSMLFYIEDGLAIFSFSRFVGIVRPGETGTFDVRKQ